MDFMYNFRMYNQGGSRTAVTSKMELFVIIVNGFQSLTIITKCSSLNVAAVLDPLLTIIIFISLTWIVTLAVVALT